MGHDVNKTLRTGLDCFMCGTKCSTMMVIDYYDTRFINNTPMVMLRTYCPDCGCVSALDWMLFHNKHFQIMLSDNGVKYERGS